MKPVRNQSHEERDSYYVAWIAPNPRFPEKICESTIGLESLAKAERVAQLLNNETKGISGHYAARKQRK